ARERAGKLWRLCGLGEKRLGRLVEGFVAAPGAILDLQLEAADGAEPHDRRRREDRDERLLDRGELLIEAHRDRRAAQLRALALLERLQGHEYDAGVRAVGEAVDRETRKRHRALHARMLERNAAHAADDVLGAVEGRAIGQLREAHQILLVLAG